MSQVNVETDIPQVVNYVATSVTVGDTTTLSSDADATVDNSGTDKNAIFNFGIPRGKSAYEQAVEGGYTGTEEEFNAALASDISTVSTNISNINAVGADIANVNTIAGDLTNIDTVAGNSSDVSTVSTNISNVNTAASNMSAIIAAPTQAANAATSASNAQKWAEGLDSDVIPLGGTHSAKGWTNVCQQIVDSIGSVLHYKGSVATYADLPAVGQTLGDMYNITSDGSNYVWTGSGWDAISGIVDLSAYRTSAAQDLIDSGKQDTLVSGTNIKTVNNTSLLGSGDITIDSLPSQTGQSGKFLTTDGTDASWATVNALPSQTGQAGRYLTTDGTDASWSIPMAGLPLFTHHFVDHLLDDPSYLRADTFSWQSGSVYVSAYQHLVDDIDGITAETETISGTTITFYRATDGHKVVLADQESNVSAIYTATGIAWYYVLDTANTRFKLPRSQWAFVGLRDTVGNYVEAGLPNIVGEFTKFRHSVPGTGGDATGALSYKSISTTEASLQTTSGTNTLVGFDFDASRSNSTFGNSTTVQQKATQMYLYFYCGNTVINQTTVDVGEITEELNYKADTDLSNLSDNGKIKSVHLAMPSDKYDELTLGASGAEYTAPADGYVYFARRSSTTGDGIEVRVVGKEYGIRLTNATNSGVLRITLPVAEGDKYTIVYDGTNTSNQRFAFYYAIGSESKYVAP